MKCIEAKIYADGTTAIGVPPLPEKSPAPPELEIVSFFHYGARHDFYDPIDVEKVIQKLNAKIQELEKDRARLDWLEQSKDSHGFCHVGYGDYKYYAHQMDGYKTVREVIDAAMSKE